MLIMWIITSAMVLLDVVLTINNYYKNRLDHEEYMKALREKYRK